MEEMEALMWLTTISQAKEGNAEAEKHLRVENELRAEQGLPTVEEELQLIAKQLQGSQQK